MRELVNYAQLVRGVGMNIGTHTGVLDFKGFAKMASGECFSQPLCWYCTRQRSRYADWQPSAAILTLRQGGSTGWTKATDDGFKAWLTEYLPWLRNSTLGTQERETPK